MSIYNLMFGLVAIITMSILLAIVMNDVKRTYAAHCEIHKLMEERMELMKLKKIILHQSAIVSQIARENKIQLPQNIEELLCTYL